MKGKYRVYARYAHEQESREISTHHTAQSAWRAADRWTRKNQCDGGELLAHVYEIVCDCDPQLWGEGYCFTGRDGEHLHSISMWDVATIIPIPGGLGYHF